MRGRLMLMAMVALLVNSSISTTSWAYDSAKCGAWRRDHPGSSYISSSFSSTTSTGDCALIGLRDERKRFIAENFDSILADSARGIGEYLDALAVVSGCKGTAAISEFRATIRENFKALYLDAPAENSSEHIPSRIDRLILQNITLHKACHLTV